MQPSQKLLVFLLFLEEFIVWDPGRVNTITELVLRALVSSLDEQFEAATQPELTTTLIHYVRLVNPLWSAILFFTSIGAIANLLGSRLPFRLNILRRRYGWLVVVAVAGWVLYQILQILSEPAASENLLQIYRNKSLWTILFGSIAIYLIVVSDNA